MLDLIRDALVYFIILEVVGGSVGLIVFGFFANRRLNATKARRNASSATDDPPA